MGWPVLRDGAQVLAVTSPLCDVGIPSFTSPNGAVQLGCFFSTYHLPVAQRPATPPGAREAET